MVWSNHGIIENERKVQDEANVSPRRGNKRQVRDGATGDPLVDINGR